MIYEVKVSEVKPGVRLKCDGSFTCLKEGEVRVVKQDENGLYIPCRMRRHYLDGQLTDRGTYTGMVLVQDVVDG